MILLTISHSLFTKSNFGFIEECWSAIRKHFTQPIALKRDRQLALTKSNKHIKIWIQMYSHWKQQNGTLPRYITRRSDCNGGRQTQIEFEWNAAQWTGTRAQHDPVHNPFAGTIDTQVVYSPSTRHKACAPRIAPINANSTRQGIEPSHACDP